MQLKPVTLILLILPCVLILCNSRIRSTNDKNTILQMASAGFQLHTIADINLPPGYTRLPTGNSDFAYWLLQIKLKKDKTVYLYDGKIKPNQQAQFAVLDISVPPENLQQCADAVMRLRAEYLFDMQQYGLIKFYDNSGKAYQFTKPYDKPHFEKFLRQVFGMCGTSSLSKQLKKKNIKAVKAGDVLIRGGFPGHAVIVMDVAISAEGKKIFLLAQSYMPAQDIHVLRNPAKGNDNPWYDVDYEKYIVTPEYTFTSDELSEW